MPDFREKVAGIGNEVMGFLNTDSREIFSKLSEHGKNLISAAYEGLYKVPGVNLAVGKLEIAYNQAWISAYDNKYQKSLVRFTTVSEDISKTRSAEEKLAATRQSLARSNSSSVSSLDDRLLKIYKKQEKLSETREKVQLKMRERAESRNLFIERRDVVADKLIDYYRERLRPINEKVVELKGTEREREEAIAVAKSGAGRLERRAGKFEKHKESVEDALRETGMSERRIGQEQAIRSINSEVAEMRKGTSKLQDEVVKQEREAAKVAARIDKVQDRGTPYVKRIHEFKNIRERQRPVNVGRVIAGVKRRFADANRNSESRAPDARVSRNAPDSERRRKGKVASEVAAEPIVKKGIEKSTKVGHVASARSTNPSSETDPKIPEYPRRKTVGLEGDAQPDKSKRAGEGVRHEATDSPSAESIESHDKVELGENPEQEVLLSSLIGRVNTLRLQNKRPLIDQKAFEKISGCKILSDVKMTPEEFRRLLSTVETNLK